MADAEGSAGPSRSLSTAPTLQRGKACLRCRKRKMRCDGAKPACQQCQRAKKADLCEYDDGKGKTRTQVLRETIAKLEARIKELEDPDRASTSITLFDPHTLALSFSEESSSSSADSPSTFSASHSPHPFSTASSPPPIGTPPVWLASENSSPKSSTAGMLADVVPIELAHSFLDIFLPHQHQIGLGIHADRLRNSLRLPVEEQRHPALMNAIYLWACFLSRASLAHHEPLYLSRALMALNDSMHNPTKIVDVIQASCLVSLYLLSNGRLAEGGHHASSAASMAMQWGLHRQLSEPPSSGPSLDSSFVLPPAQDAIEQGERVLAFWQCFYLDHCWSVLLQRPAILYDGRDTLSAITVPWPQDMVEYESGNMINLLDFTTVQAFLAPHSQMSNFSAGGFSNFALQAKASALFEAATRVSSTWASSVTLQDTPDEETVALENTITRFSNSLLPVHQMNAVRASDKHCLVLVHTLAQAAIIRLHYSFGENDAARHEKCMHAARACLFILRHVSEADLEFLDPAMLCCWGAAGSVFIREISRIEAWSSISSTELRAHVGTFLAAMAKLGVTFPLAGFLASRLQATLNSI
ncbi:hypothetical protein BV25DRAFT_1912800 [Artomyces pyxidatus]|uniref:Uncharacterized protein n=2 Tax=Artomyces pyxidatus TaxID=48021 RepID=A0ACB8TCU6_9AGAM|nr:hypothetical protein BV25DRAFT_1919655 [Artomyces pyxidatus]KAI0065991.1 hypothetical protein BV25DRAFT_1912800 [Artomyces pyxidatus]